MSGEEQEKIRSFDLWIIEIDYKNNKNFEPIDLFVRLNNKPYPIKDDTFEMWNSYISRDIIETIKSIHNNHSNWFYFRKNNSRMENENIYTALAYFQYCRDKKSTGENIFSYPITEIDIYKIGNKINFRVKSKNEITRVLEDANSKVDFIKAINHLEFDFIRKLKELLSDSCDTTHQKLNKNLDDIFMIGNGRRTQQSFYALWYFLFDISFEKIKKDKINIRSNVKQLFSKMTDIKDKQTFEEQVFAFKNNYSLQKQNRVYDNALLKDISVISIGIRNLPLLQQNSFEDKIEYNCFNNRVFTNFNIGENDLLDQIKIDGNLLVKVKDVFDSKAKILITRNYNSFTRFNSAFSDSRLAFNDDIIGISLKRPTFLTKYILSLLSSKYYYKYYTKKWKNSNGSKPLSLSDLDSMEIPVLSIEEQKIFEVIVDYIMNSKPNSKIVLFYERIMDAMVYEIQFKEQFSKAGIDIKIYVSEFPDLNPIEKNKRMEQTEILYSEISAPNHNLGANLLKLMNISEVNEIESLY
ncbi:hypothetical protein EZS27_030157 [termite gut metagenome]|uniref:Uncharacterized protein n=1 Tax=termite gut metagenome TaxID=433724 RepID=A0A5J4QHD6_9ZZZZ